MRLYYRRGTVMKNFHAYRLARAAGAAARKGHRLASAVGVAPSE